VEFAKGAFPTAVNLPLMSDQEREAVGIRYKNNGNEAAVKLGYQLVSGDIKEMRITAWQHFIQKHPHALLYCFRGGQRSRISQQWLHERGYPITRIEGGYKAFRNYLLTELETMEGRFRPLLLGGRTGSGKTVLLRKIAHMIDLEGIAKHRGSAFGKKIEPQPTQIDFENRLAFDLIQKLHKGYRHLVFEDEGKNVGRVYLPEKFFQTIAKAGVVILETPLDERVEITFTEYVTLAQKEYLEYFGESEGVQKWADTIGGSIDRIERRLGSERHRRLKAIFDDALKEQMDTQKTEQHKAWIKILLKEYYDPMYDYQLSKKSNKILFRGEKEAVETYLNNLEKES
jgi:tRNA 2-selenouridine synthase